MSTLSEPADFQLPELKIPILVQLGLTYRCNLKCSHCYALYRRDRNEFTFDELRKLTQDLYAAGAAAVVYSHGENMIRRDFHDVAALFRDLHFYQTLMLNGYYVRQPADAQRLVDAGINRCMISIDSVDPEVHDRVRGKAGAFDTAMRAADLLLDTSMDTVGFSSTIDRHNYDDIEGIVQLALDRGVHAISFMQNRYNLRDIFDRALWRRYEEVCAEIYEIMLRYRGRLDIYTHDPFMLTLLDQRLDDNAARDAFIGANLCNVGTSMVSIDPVGNVTGCNFISEAVGNLREEPFAVIWDRLVDKYSDTRQPPTGACSGCGVLSACMGGCKAFHYIGKYDERCGETRFGERHPHGLPVAAVEQIVPDRPAGAFLGMPRVGVRPPTAGA
ncbi:radical SAM/SPASM domain-containing protein [Micromonospora sagamiensis]|uniref:Radical SAM protein with 4Fe4S-binding SPASM domain n=1 Tax=Micromonospora sagamiensis TaxID=47875 RepID=A0A562WLA6_9ACTN|nr:radical SAM protein [Micromonospora sagamiensis]TWJ30304.1 radical SAM protein with 4Fe4S-binding SPASM domain [Micromonospora sagamiensis]BCL16666.1 radical SAM/SPASM domain-containing protein [Micromonospora sagamiensis]